MKVAYVLASTRHGTLIVNRNDENRNDEYGTYGVGWNLLETGEFYQSDITLLTAILKLRVRALGGARPVVAIDCGANLGVLTIEFARTLGDAGRVIAIEAQRSVYYALCGNVAINNCFNVDARHVAIGGENGTLTVPFIDYHRKSSFGSLELVRGEQNEDIGQPIHYGSGYAVPLITLDSLNEPHVDLVKIDVEGMEEAVIAGGLATLRAARPVMFIEKIKSDLGGLQQTLTDLGYDLHDLGPNLLAVSRDDPSARDIRALVDAQSGAAASGGA
jgi:FkbM family methyltransferase